MPIISTFFGIVIRMFYKEHEPPHFHAEHQGQQAKPALSEANGCNFDGGNHRGLHPVSDGACPHPPMGCLPPPRA